MVYMHVINTDWLCSCLLNFHANTEVVWKFQGPIAHEDGVHGDIFILDLSSVFAKELWMDLKQMAQVETLDIAVIFAWI